MTKVLIQKRIAFSGMIMIIVFLGLFNSTSVRAADFSTKEVMALINEAREEQGLPPFAENDLLSQAAQSKVADMIKHNYFAHTSPQGLSPWHWLQKINYPYQYAGENLAVNYTNAKQQQIAWMKSPTHRKNILSAKFKEIGVVVVQGRIDGEDALVTVTLFGAVAPPPVIPWPAAVSPAPQVQGVAIGAADPITQASSLSTRLKTIPVQGKMPKNTDLFQVVQAVALIIFKLTFVASAGISVARALRTLSAQLEKTSSVSLALALEAEEYQGHQANQSHGLWKKIRWLKVHGINSS